jgi:hypothetical protein
MGNVIPAVPIMHACGSTLRFHVCCADVQDEHAQRLAALRGRTAELKVWAAWSDLPPDLEDALFR